MSIRTTSGPSCVRQAHGLLAVGGLADDLDVVLRVEQCLEARPDERLVVGEQDANHRERQRRAHAEAALGARAGVELAADRRDPLAHPRQAVAAAVRGAPRRGRRP